MNQPAPTHVCSAREHRVVRLLQIVNGNFSGCGNQTLDTELTPGSGGVGGVLLFVGGVEVDGTALIFILLQIHLVYFTRGAHSDRQRLEMKRGLFNSTV